MRRCAIAASGRAQPGTRSLRRYLDHWFRGHSLGIYNCRNVAGTNHLSTHAEGRSLDWALNAAVPRQHREAHRIIHYFLRDDSFGRPRAMARRWGIEVIIYNEHLWSVTHDSEGWRPCRSLLQRPRRPAAHRAELARGQAQD